MTDPSVAGAFVSTSRDHLIGEYYPKIARCLEVLGDEGVWWRPNAESNSVGNLVLHTCGNARQWIATGILGRPDTRQRDAEFAASGDQSVEDLATHLTTEMTFLEDAFEELKGLVGSSPGTLHERRTIQGLDVSVLEALYHVVEHAAQHTGQIIYIAKLRSANDLGFWVVDSGVARPNW